MQMTATHNQSAPAHSYDYFRQASRQMHSLLSLAHVDRMTGIYMEGTYQFVLLSQGATRSLNTQRTSFPPHATRFLPLWCSQHKILYHAFKFPHNRVTDGRVVRIPFHSRFQISIQRPDISTEVSCGLLSFIRSNVTTMP